MIFHAPSRTRHIVLIAAMLLTAFMAAARPDSSAVAAPDARLVAKAHRFFEHGEWLNAAASYLSLASQHPRNTGFYAHAIVSQYLSGDTIGALSMVERSMHNDVPIDSMLSGVNVISMEAGSPTLYHTMLTQLRERFPWLARNIDLRLLDYYTFRNDAPEMISLARRLLGASPDNRRLLMTLARGYLIDGQYGSAEAIWRRMLVSRPDDADAMLWLGILYDNTGRNDVALDLLQRAFALRPSPYLQRLIDRHNPALRH